MPSNRLAPMQSLDNVITRDINALRRRVHRLFGDNFAELETETVGWSPAVDLSETDREFVLTADLPGMKPADVTVECQDGTLTLKGEKSEEKKDTGDGNRWHLYERSYGSFFRSFAFPQPVDSAKAMAQFANGVLTVRVPKALEAKPTTHKVEIKSA